MPALEVGVAGGLVALCEFGKPAQRLVLGLELRALDRLAQCGKVGQPRALWLQLAAQPAQCPGIVALPGAYPVELFQCAGRASAAFEPAQPEQLADVEPRFVLQAQACLIDAWLSIQRASEAPQRTGPFAFPVSAHLRRARTGSKHPLCGCRIPNPIFSAPLEFACAAMIQVADNEMPRGQK